MSRAVIADRARLSWLVLRRKLNILKGRMMVHPVAAPFFWRPSGERLVIAPQDLRTADADPRQRNLCRPLRLRRQGRGLRRPLDLRDGAAVRGMGGGAARLRLAAPSARRRFRHHPRQCARAGRRMDRAAGRLAPDRLAARTCCRGASSPGSARRRWCSQDADVRFYRRFLRSLMRQVRYLRHTAGDTQRGVPRLQARIALSYAALCIAGQARHIKRGDRAAVAASSSARSCPMAAISAAIPARSSSCCSTCCRCGRPSRRATSRRRRRCSTPSTA